MDTRQLWMAAGILSLVAGCNSTTPAECGSLSCLVEQAKQPYYRACVKDLRWHDTYSYREKKAVNKRYRYPLTNLNTYHSLLVSGGRGPSPTQWCRRYADSLAQDALARR